MKLISTRLKEEKGHLGFPIGITSLITDEISTCGYFQILHYEGFYVDTVKASC